jgi:hypothetical protein
MTSRPITVPIKLRHNTGPSRSSGIHLSGVLHAIAIRIGTLKAREEDLDELIGRVDPEAVGNNGTLVRICIGYAWEDWIFRRLPNVIHQPGALMLDDVWGSPDGLEFSESGDIILHEAKTTFKSSKSGITELWKWQVCGYLKMLQVKWREECRTVVFHPLYIRGDNKGIDPQYLPTEITFEQAEIESVWDMVKRNKHLAQPEEWNKDNAQ